VTNAGVFKAKRTLVDGNKATKGRGGKLEVGRFPVGG